MMLSTKVRYAVMAMVELAGRSSARPVPLSELAQSQSIPLPYLEQIFARLGKKGLVESVRGPGGGILLARGAQYVTVGEIVEAMEEKMKMTRCEGQHELGCMPTHARCATHDLWEGLEQRMHEYLNGIALSDIHPRHERLPRL
ncbi:MAG: Rrf2 family transcriptional regulator [Alphaproteobacteria bacterium]|nr:Rrf2 family transcriptional regulator [Alphaproteobacteria bacterium]